MPRNPNKIDYTGGLPSGFERFTVVEDPRSGGNKKHHFGELLFIAVSALVCGVQSFSGMIEFAHLYEDWLKKWIKLPHGIPVPQTMTNLFAILDSKKFAKCVADHINDLYPDLAKQLIAVDGKSLRGSGVKTSELDHCLSAWAADTGVTIALEFVQHKSNEIPAIPKLLEQLELRGHVVSVDAMGTQTAIATQIKEQGADYLMALKGNQGALHAEVIDQFHFAKTQIDRGKSEKWSLHKEVEKSHGRVTTRRVAVTNDLDWMQKRVRKRWNGLRSLIAIDTESYNVTKQKTTKQTRFYISSLDATAERFQKLIRRHWSIENGCHWVLDTLFREDHS